MKVIKINSNHEHLLQVSCCKYLETLKKLNQIIEYFAVPNGTVYGAKNNIVYGAKMKREGVKAGVSDLVVILKQKILFIELKFGKNKQTDSQKEFENNILKGNQDIMQYSTIYDFGAFCKLIENNLK
jgi:hypothetical protein